MAGYKKENCTLVAWVQKNNGNKEVYQAVKLDLGEEAPDYDLGIVSVEEIPSESCSGRIKPRMTFRNYGSETITSFTFNIFDGVGEQLGSFEWTGNLAKGQEEEIQFDEINFGETSSVTIETVNLNGTNSDDYPYDNTFIFNAASPYELPNGYMKIQLRTGSDPENFSIEIKNMQTGEILHNLTFEDANKIYQEEINLPEFGCYRVTLKHALGNGISQSSFWGIKDENNETVVMGSNSDNNFRYELPIELVFSGDAIESIECIDDIDIYPNPASAVINVSAKNLTKVNVFNAIGQLVYSQNVDTNIVKIDTDSWTNGLYYVNVETKDGVKTSQKIIVSK